MANLSVCSLTFEILRIHQKLTQSVSAEDWSSPRVVNSCVVHFTSSSTWTNFQVHSFDWLEVNVLYRTLQWVCNWSIECRVYFGEIWWVQVLISYSLTESWLHSWLISPIKINGQIQFLTKGGESNKGNTCDLHSNSTQHLLVFHKRAWQIFDGYKS